jgi:hypothetical protein
LFAAGKQNRQRTLTPASPERLLLNSQGVAFSEKIAEREF